MSKIYKSDEIDNLEIIDTNTTEERNRPEVNNQETPFKSFRSAESV